MFLGRRYGSRFIFSSGLLFMLVQSALFVVFVLANWAIGASDKWLILAPNILFFLSSGLFFLFSGLRGYILIPIVWFVFGAGVFFGLGPIASAFKLHPYTGFLYGDRIDYIHSTNFICSLSIFIVLLVSNALLMREKSPTFSDSSRKPLSWRKVSFFWLCVLAFASLLSFKLIFFTGTENLIIRSFADKGYSLLPGFLVFFGLMFFHLGKGARSLVVGFTLTLSLIGFISASKFEIIMPVVALFIGLLARPRPLIYFISCFSFLLLLFFGSVDVVNNTRAHKNFVPSNTLLERVLILSDVYNHGVRTDLYHRKKPSVLFTEPGVSVNRILYVGRAILNRLDLASVQGFLIEEFDSGRRGTSLDKFWHNLIPRVLWPAKPVMTSHGNNLSGKYFDDPGQKSSSMAPSYVGEAYWNFGIWGVLVVSTYLGVLLAGWSKISLLTVTRPFSGYPFVAFNIAFSAVYVESWIGPTYIGGMITSFAIFIIVYLITSSLKLER